MNKKEKYINYIVEDMIKNTEIDYDREKIKYSSTFLHFPFILFPFYYFLLLFSSPLPSFSKHVIERYGIHDNDVDIIWKLYKGKIKEVIDNG